MDIAKARFPHGVAAPDMTDASGSTAAENLPGTLKKLHMVQIEAFRGQLEKANQLCEAGELAEAEELLELASATFLTTNAGLHSQQIMSKKLEELGASSSLENAHSDSPAMQMD